jgi:hypothetical protein
LAEIAFMPFRLMEMIGIVTGDLDHIFGLQIGGLACFWGVDCGCCPGLMEGALELAGIAGIKHPKLFIFPKNYRVLAKSYPPYPQTPGA